MRYLNIGNVVGLENRHKIIDGKDTDIIISYHFMAFQSKKYSDNIINYVM